MRENTIFSCPFITLTNITRIMETRFFCLSLQGSSTCNPDWENWWHMVLITRAEWFILNNTARKFWSMFLLVNLRAYNYLCVTCLYIRLDVSCYLPSCINLCSHVVWKWNALRLFRKQIISYKSDWVYGAKTLLLKKHLLFF